MRAVVISRPGGPGVLELRDVPEPAYGPEEVRVAVRATALNRADLLQRRGRYPAPPGAPADIPGLEFAGEVESRGERVVDLRPGDRVMGLLGGGGYAEKVSLHERMCLRIPPTLGWEEAAAVPEAFMTAFDALFERGRLRPGGTVLLHAAASGVGTAALQIAGVAGARAIALSRSADKRRRLEEMGLTPVFDPASPGLAESIRAAAGGGVDLVVDLLGADAWGVNLEVLDTGGRIVLVGTVSGSRVEADLSLLMRKRLTVVGTVLRSRPIEEKIALARAFDRRVVPLLASGRLRPVIDRVLPLAAAAQAHAAMEANENFGKIVLRVD
ncbi:MAG: NAD(P)H-quinone oxidoreductase [Acidobacteriia bacterium]|nr:NAD(P)H-quinone oxidoreductase [Terriglobia bacterium]